MKKQICIERSRCLDLRIRKGDTDKLFYVHPDRPGSYTHITDETLKQQPV